MTRLHPLKTLRAVATLFAFATSTALDADAQSTRTQSAAVSFASGQGGTGFANARVVVRYAFLNFPVTNLWNKEGLPAGPFRSDIPK